MLLLHLISYGDSMWPLTLSLLLRMQLRWIWGSDMWADCVYTETETCHGKVTFSKVNWSRPMALCSMFQGELPPTHFNLLHPLIRDLLSLLICRLIGSNAFSPCPKSPLVLTGSTLHRIHVKVFIHNHVGHKSKGLGSTAITREHLNQQPFFVISGSAINAAHWLEFSKLSE